MKNALALLEQLRKRRIRRLPHNEELDILLRITVGQLKAVPGELKQFRKALKLIETAINNDGVFTPEEMRELRKFLDALKG